MNKRMNRAVRLVLLILFSPILVPLYIAALLVYVPASAIDGEW